MIVETIVTTVAGDGAVNCAPMGVDWDPITRADAIVLKPFLETAVMHRGTRRDFIGFNRACHAVLETAIYATRVHLLTRAFLESELARLQIIVDKTAGPHEREAMALLTDYIRSAPAVVGSG